MKMKSFKVVPDREYRRPKAAKKASAFPNGNKPDLYLDVDGVLLMGWDAKGDRIENDWLIDWILASKHRFRKIYWLSCWTGGGSAKRLYERHPRFRDFGAKAVKWPIAKTDAIDWSRPFIWIEDGFGGDEALEFARRASKDQNVWQIRLGEQYENARNGDRWRREEMATLRYKLEAANKRIEELTK